MRRGKRPINSSDKANADNYAIWEGKEVSAFRYTTRISSLIVAFLDEYFTLLLLHFVMILLQGLPVYHSKFFLNVDTENDENSYHY